MAEDTTSPEASSRKDGKRAYSRPVLVEYGSISKLTQSGGSTKKESGVPQMKMCL